MALTSRQLVAACKGLPLCGEVVSPLVLREAVVTNTQVQVSEVTAQGIVTVLVLGGVMFALILISSLVKGFRS